MKKARQMSRRTGLRTLSHEAERQLLSCGAAEFCHLFTWERSKGEVTLPAESTEEHLVDKGIWCHLKDMGKRRGF